MIRYGIILLLLLGCAGRSAQPAVQKEAAPAPVEQKVAPSKAKGAEYFAQQRFNALERLIRELRGKSDLEKLKGINDFFNRVRFASDQQTWGVEDYWATPTEFIGRAGGDCEDYVISKYFVLRSLDIPDDKLHLAYVTSTEQNIRHMVVNYFETPGSSPLVLDNYNPEVLPASKRSDLRPIYSFPVKCQYTTTGEFVSQGSGQLQNAQGRQAAETTGEDESDAQEA